MPTILGIVFELIATVSFALGNTFEKKAVDRMPDLSFRRVFSLIKRLVSSSVWVAGAFISILGVCAQILALERISLSLAQPIGLVGIVVLMIISVYHFHERFSPQELVGIAVSVCAIVLMSLSLSRSSDAAGTRHAIAGIAIATVSSFAVVGVLLFAKRLRHSSLGLLYGSAAGILYGLNGLSTKAIATFLVEPNRLTYVTNWRFEFCIFVFGISLIAALIVFQIGLQRGRVGIVVPLASTVGSMYVVGIGTPTFGEHLPTNSVLLVFRLVSYAGILAGSTLIARAGVAKTLNDATEQN